MATPQFIGAVSRQSGLSIQTIRYYAELGLLKTQGRTAGGYRLFGEDVFVRLHFIKRAQRLGLTLTDIKELLDIYDGGKMPCDRVKEKLSQKVTEIEQQIEQLHLLKQELQGLLRGWPAMPTPPQSTICPVLQRLP
ncbi:heavy metal-responsive transcriptional regulator [Thermosynechococcaceae cyanobacterium Okahandja]